MPNNERRFNYFSIKRFPAVLTSLDHVAAIPVAPEWCNAKIRLNYLLYIFERFLKLSHRISQTEGPVRRFVAAAEIESET
jgi:hypothetical protein